MNTNTENKKNVIPFSSYQRDNINYATENPDNWNIRGQVRTHKKDEKTKCLKIGAMKRPRVKK